LICGANVLLQLLLTRLFSITLAYHFAFVVVSLVMLSLAAPGAMLAAFPNLWRRHLPERAAGGFALFFAVALAMVLVVYLAFPFRVSTPHVDRLFTDDGPRNLLAVFAMWGGIFILGGFAPTLVLTRYPEHSARLYAWDLVGAGLGGALFLPILAWMTGVQALLVTAGVFAASAAVLWWPARSLRWGSVGLATALSLFAVWNASLWPESLVRIRYAKFYNEPRPMIELWSPTSRITVFDHVGEPLPLRNDQPFGWAMSKNLPVDRPKPKEYWMEQDAGAGTPITNWDGKSTATVNHILYDVSSIVLRTTAPETMLVIGSGGGRDVLGGLIAGAEKVTAVEMNPVTYRIGRELLASFNGQLFNNPRVEFVRDEGRNWLRSQRDRRFDVILLSLVDSMAATAAGGLVFVENFLYTQEAFDLYFERLTDNGCLTLAWYWLGEPPATVYRIVASLGAVLRDRGITEPHRHIQIIRNDVGVTFNLFRSPVTEEKALAIRRESVALGFEVIADGLVPPANKDLAELMVDPQKVTDRYPFNFNPATDDNPFWLYITKPGENYSDTHGPLRILLIASLMMTPLFLLMAGGVVVFVLLPLGIAMGRGAGRGWVGWRAATGIGLACLGCGLGYMALELALMHGAVQLLGYPAYAVTIVLVGMLVGSGLGSAAAGQLAVNPALHAGRLTALAALFMAVGLSLLLPTKVEALAVFPWGLRALAMLLFCLVLGAVLGVPFPSLLRWIANRNLGGGGGHSAAAWAWCLNGAAGTLAGVAVMLVAMRAGYSAVFMAAGLCYLAALVGLILCQPQKELTAP
jgi:hypothetical protein